jgi:hypothetical protein
VTRGHQVSWQSEIRTKQHVPGVHLRDPFWDNSVCWARVRIELNMTCTQLMYILWQGPVWRQCYLGGQSVGRVVGNPGGFRSPIALLHCVHPHI